MIKSIGLIEVMNISKGIKITDEMLKSANVELIDSGSVCPGKYVTVIGGNLAAISAAVERAAEIAEGALIDKFVIGSLGDKVYDAVSGTANTSPKGALGIIETFTAASAIKAADAAVKSGVVDLIEVRIARGMGGKCFVALTGEVADVLAAVEAGAKIAIDEGVLINTEVIANPHPDLWQTII